jgi:hypothetical protein
MVDIIPVEPNATPPATKPVCRKASTLRRKFIDGRHIDGKWIDGHWESGRWVGGNWVAETGDDKDKPVIKKKYKSEPLYQKPPKSPYRGHVWLKGYKCHCGHKWITNGLWQYAKPIECPLCKDKNWDESPIITAVAKTKLGEGE